MIRNSFFLAVFLAAVTPVFSQVVRTTKVQLEEVTGSAILEGKVRGNESVDYTVVGKAGQTLNVDLQSDTSSQNFNVIPPEGGNPLFVGSVEGKKNFTGTLAADGEYTIRVYLMGAARDEGGNMAHTVTVSVVDAAADDEESAGFDKKLTLSDVTFHVTTSVNDQGRTLLKVKPTGLADDNTAMEAYIAGEVVDAEVVDLNEDGSPEIYVFSSSGKDKVGTVHGWSADKKKALTPIYLMEPEESNKEFAGYQGHDKFEIKNGYLVRTFPVGENKVVSEYQLYRGEAAWQLFLLRSVKH